MRSPARLWARRVHKSKRNAYMPDRVLVVLEGRDGGKGLVMVVGWSMPPATVNDRMWPKPRLVGHLKTLTKEWKELSGPGWKLEIE